MIFISSDAAPATTSRPLSDWKPSASAQPPDSRHRPSLVTALVCKLKNSLLTKIARRGRAAPPASRSLIFALCEEYQQSDLWAAYYAFRLDPQVHTWQRLRRRSVAWQRGETVEALLNRLCPLKGKRTPDPATVGLAIVTTSSSSRSDKNQPKRG
jgi:hypothetical protein